ncbi:MAG: orotidine-5'-phosphate decarboxylase [Candidatus Omnitrophica bacterium]|nr:orotidine-5'-phosphate decarboxylase [Candidatus Omnitrophota bacterium]
MEPIKQLIVALDLKTEDAAIEMAEKLKEYVGFFKIGLELFSSCGPRIVERIRETGCDVFLDLKFYDIPTTVAKASVAVTSLKPLMFNVHALGGYEMMRRTAEAVTAEAARLGIAKPNILAVTILTSFDEKALKDIGVEGSPKEAVLRLAHLAKKAGLDGVVAAPTETKAIRQNLGKDFLIVTPGVRPAWAAVDDQKRIMTPKEAVAAGADYIVVGRPVTESADPADAAQEILREMES